MKKLYRTYRFLNRLKADDGVVAIEFAIASMALIVIMLGVFEFGSMLWVSNGLQYAVEKGARLAAIQQDNPNSDVVDEVNQALESLMIDSTNAQLEINDITGAGGVALVEVRASYQFSFGLLFFVPESIRIMDLTAVSRRPVVL